MNVRFALDLRIVIAVLLGIIVAMLFVWMPWSSGTSNRTIEVTGEATVKAVPDEYVFYPTYQFSNADKNAALKDVSAKSDEITAKLKALGVADKDIKVDSSGYDPALYNYEVDQKNAVYTLQMTVTVDNKDMAQKVQDYLVTTSPTGAVSPQPTFSDSLRKKLEGQARTAATKDARAKANETAANLNFKVGKVKTVSEAAMASGGIRPLTTTMAVDSAQKSFAVQPGENELPYSVTVVYYIR